MLLRQLESTRVQLIILSLVGNQLFVVAALYYLTVIQHYYHIGIAHSGQSVCNHEHRSSLHKRIHSSRDYRFRSCIYGRRSFVEYHYGRICDCGTRYRHKLTLTLRKVCAVTCEQCIISVGQTGYKIVRARQLCRRYALLVRGVQLAVADIVHYRARRLSLSC